MRKLTDKVMVQVTIKQLANMTACVAVVLSSKPEDADQEDVAELKGIISALVDAAGLPPSGRAAFQSIVDAAGKAAN